MNGVKESGQRIRVRGKGKRGTKIPTAAGQNLSLCVTPAVRSPERAAAVVLRTLPEKKSAEVEGCCEGLREAALTLGNVLAKHFSFIFFLSPTFFL